MKKLNDYFSQNPGYGILLLRLFVGFRLIYGTIDNIISWERMIEFSKFLEANNFPFPQICAVSSVYVQFLGGLMILLGYKIRLASTILILNFIVAVSVHVKAGDSVESTTPALAILSICLAFLFLGAGKFSLDEKLR